MILALDTGTATGVAWGKIGATPKLATLRLPDGGRADVGRFFSRFADALHDMIVDIDPTLIVFEAPFIGGKLVRNMHSARRVIGLPCVVEMLAHRHGIECAEAGIFDVRGFLLNDRKAKKAPVLPAVVARGLTPANDHEADAAAVWFYTAHMRQTTERVT